VKSEPEAPDGGWTLLAKGMVAFGTKIE